MTKTNWITVWSSPGNTKTRHPVINRSNKDWQSLLKNSENQIIWRQCNDCNSAPHRNIFYRRISPWKGTDIKSLFLHTWSISSNGKANRLNVDFELYSSYDDALKRIRRWNWCNYNDRGIGFPRDCGPHRPVGGQWRSWSSRTSWNKNWRFKYLIEQNKQEAAIEKDKLVKSLTKSFFGTDPREHFTDMPKNIKKFYIGNNLGQVHSKHVINNQIDKMLLLPTYSITFTVTTYRNDNNWRNIYHYGNNNGERMPAMWIFPRNPWRYHFRIRTSRSRNHGVDFNIPRQFRKYNKKMTITTVVSGSKMVLWPYRKKFNNGRYINVKHYVSFENGKKVLAGEGNMKADIHIVLKRKMWIKNPWYARGGYIVNSLHIDDNTDDKKKNIKIIDLGGNNTRNAKKIKNPKIDKLLSQKTYSISADITVNKNNRSWRNIYHYGDNNGERMPALWIFPNNPWRYHFRLRTNRRWNDGYDFNIPKQFRKYNNKFTITTVVTGSKRTMGRPGVKSREVNSISGGNKINIKHYISSDNTNKILIGEKNFELHYIWVLLGRHLWIKDPWHNRNDYQVHSIKIDDEIPDKIVNWEKKSKEMDKQINDRALKLFTELSNKYKVKLDYANSQENLLSNQRTIISGQSQKIKNHKKNINLHLNKNINLDKRNFNHYENDHTFLEKYTYLTKIVLLMLSLIVLFETILPGSFNHIIPFFMNILS